LLLFGLLGGTIGGPVIKNRVFFFAVENIVNHGGAHVNLMTVPTNAMRTGDYARPSSSPLRKYFGRFDADVEHDRLTPKALAQGRPAKLGLQIAKADIFPTINVTGFYSLASGVHANYKRESVRLLGSGDARARRHILHFGGEVLINRADSAA
jgi:hypothetical protein